MARTTKTTSKHRPSGRGGKSRYIPKRKVCPFCVNKVREIDYKDVALLRRFISERGRMEPRRKTGVCARHQRVLSVALKRARHIALLPYTADHVRQGTGFGFRETHPRGAGQRAARMKEPVHVETRPEEPVVEESKAEEPKTEEIKAEETKAEKTKAEKTKAEKSKTEEPKAEETTIEEPVPEEASPDEKSD